MYIPRCSINATYGSIDDLNRRILKHHCFGNCSLHCNSPDYDRSVFPACRDWCLAQWLILSSTSVVRTWGRIPLGKFLAAKLNIQYPVKSLAPYLGGRRGWVPSDSLRKFLQEVNLYNSFNIFSVSS